MFSLGTRDEDKHVKQEVMSHASCPNSLFSAHWEVNSSDRYLHWVKEQLSFHSTTTSTSFCSFCMWTHRRSIDYWLLIIDRWSLRVPPPAARSRKHTDVVWKGRGGRKWRSGDGRHHQVRQHVCSVHSLYLIETTPMFIWSPVAPHNTFIRFKKNIMTDILSLRFFRYLFIT